MLKSQDAVGAADLAALGGSPVHEKQWPAWPRAGTMAQRAVLDVLHSARWTVTAASREASSYEQRFAETFAAYVNRQFGVPCSSGSAAITIALQALGIGPGDEVIVPGMTWVACASAVAHLGAVPVLVDISSSSLCMAPDAVEAAITPATKVVLAVHMYASRIDMAKLREICDRRRLLMIEDGSQAHGGSLPDGPVGGFGVISVFSFQQTKLLTSGEGGIAVTDDPTYFESMQKFRADGRVYSQKIHEGGFYDLADIGGVMGRNLCMSEFQAAILLEGLQRLDRENMHRMAMAEELVRRLDVIGDFEIVRDSLAWDAGATFYKIPLRTCREELLRLGPVKVARAMSAELNLQVEPLDRPLDRNPLYQPLACPLVARTPAFAELVDPRRFDLSNAVDAWKSCIGLPHPCLLGGMPEIEAIVTAIGKICAGAAQLANWD